MRKWLPFYILISVCLLAGTAAAFVAQDASSALVFNNYARGGSAPTRPVSSPAPSAASPAKPYAPVDDVVDRKAIARRMFGAANRSPAETVGISVNFTSASSKNIRIKAGQTFRVKLPQEDGTDWKAETNNDTVELVGSSNSGRIKYLDFRAMVPGSARVYLDCIHSAPGKSGAVESRILRVKVLP